MKNKLIISIFISIFFFQISENSSANDNDFIFESDSIELLENGNLIKASNDVQITTKNAENTHFGFPMILKNDDFFTRNEICEFLNKNGIETRPIIAGNLARQPANDLFEHRVSGKLNNSDHIMDNGFSVGVHQSLSGDAINYVTGKIKEFISLRVK